MLLFHRPVVTGPSGFSDGDVRRRTHPSCMALQDNLVAAGMFRLVERVVGDAVQSLKVAGGLHFGDADTRGDEPVAKRFAVIARGNFAPDAFGETIERDPLHPDRQQAELLPAEAGHRADRPLPSRDAPRDPAQDGVAGIMAVDIVDRFEAIDVDHEECGMPADRMLLSSLESSCARTSWWLASRSKRIVTAASGAARSGASNRI